jgi:uracil-DNA glycosylase family 4
MDDHEIGLLAARRIVAQRLESLQRSGLEQLRKAPPLPPAEGGLRSNPGEGVLVRQADATTLTPALSQRERETGQPASPSHSPPVMPRAKPSPSATTLPLSLTQPYPTDLPSGAADRQRLLDELNAEVRACTLCRELACSRKQTVFGVGSAKPRVVFFGEAPGADEDRQGEPFVGRAGQLLTKIIEACGWQRSDVYIMNVLKCRPPDNRNPLPSETENCRPFFERQFEILRPEYIVCVGTVPAQALLETAESVGKLRGRFHRYKDSTVLVTYHPSYLLRNPSAKKFVWDDMQLLLKEMGLPIPGRG